MFTTNLFAVLYSKQYIYIVVFKKKNVTKGLNNCA